MTSPQYVVHARPLPDVLTELREALQIPIDTSGAGNAPASLIPLWMIPTILEFPQLTIQFLDELTAQRFPQHEFERWRHVDAHRTASILFDSVRNENPSDTERIRKILSEVMMGLGIGGALAFWVALAIGLILLKLGPVGVVLAIIAMIVGFIILAVVTALIVIISVVKAILGLYAQSLETLVAVPVPA
ncbi:MAG TPA: hypothetical protein VMU84_17625 [Thermoanaerobaculia bacterium]|nr:hypothetical protein [Thermoanaerobaculia bacterium]